MGHRSKERESGQMEILNKLLEFQNSLEDALRLEITPEEINDTECGKKLLRYLRRRHRITSRFVKGLSKIF